MKRSTILMLVAGVLTMYACSSSTPVTNATYTAPDVAPVSEATPGTPDPRVGLEAGLFDAGEAIWNLEMLSTTPPAEDFVGVTNSDLAFLGPYAIQGNYNGMMIWNLSDPENPVLTKDYLCPASQSDVSVYGNLLFVSGEGYGGRLDCGTQGNQGRVSEDRLRGIRIFDISDIENPEYIANVQTCRGSHTHSVLKDPEDDENVYIYVSGSAPVRPDEELPGCSAAQPEEDPNSALFRIEVIKVPLNAPEEAAIVSSPRIFENLEEPPTHGQSPADIAAMEEAKAKGAFTFMRNGSERLLSDGFARRLLNNIVEERGGSEITAADTLTLRETATDIINTMYPPQANDETARRGPTQCHDITLYPEIGLAGGACEGYGLLLDISDPANPVRVDAVADSNFAYWHSATFTNDGSKVLFTDEWGGGGQPKCREADPMEWGANAIFSITEDKKLEFESYYKMPAPQTAQENCVAHNGSMIPVPGRDIMVQSWYQGGISIFDWTDPENPVEIAFHDRGPVNPDRMSMGGSWSVYWYNGLIVNSEIARGLDIFELTPSPFLTMNEIEASKTVSFDYLNAQGQPQYEFPNTFWLAKAYVDQLDRDNELSDDQIRMLRQTLANAEASDSKASRKMLQQLSEELGEMVTTSGETSKVAMLQDAVQGLAAPN